MSFSTDSTYKLLIHSSKWLKIRNRYIKGHPLCECCGQLATAVHHRIPLNNYRTDKQKMEELAFDEDNLMAVCDECHNKLHIELGKYNNVDMQAVNKEKVDSFFKKYFE